MPRSLSSAAPQYPVKKCEDAGDFIILRAPRFDAEGKFGEQWALICEDVRTGERFVLLFTANKVRDQQMTDLTLAFTEGDEPVGPCMLESRPTNVPGRTTWNIIDSDMDIAEYAKRANTASVRN